VNTLLASHPDVIQTLADDDRRKLPDAAQDNNLRAVRLMLTASWPVHERGQHNGTALHWAAFHGNVEMAEALLIRNPPLEVTDADFNSTPLGWAIHGSEHGWNCETGKYAETVETLLKAGAKPPQDICGSDDVKAVLLRWRQNPSQSH
jgi:ankyrin repeat protein